MQLPCHPPEYKVALQMFMLHSNHRTLYLSESVASVSIIDPAHQRIRSSTGSDYTWFHEPEPGFEMSFLCCRSHSLEQFTGVCQDREHF